MVTEANRNGKQVLRFGPFELLPQSGELSRNGVMVKLPPQPFKVLVILLENAGQLVSREELQKQVWGTDTFVDFDKGLNFCIKQIRESLGDNAQSPQYIETLPRRGYRFIASVDTSIHHPAPESANANGNFALAHPTVTPLQESLVNLQQSGNLVWRRMIIILAVFLPLAFYFLWLRFPSRVNPAGGKVMLAVLPFENLNEDTSQDYFSDGLTEEMIAQLGRLRPQRLGIIARTTALTYKHTNKDIRQIGRELGVNYVLEGSVRREADRVRITAQLIQVSDQTHLWAETYERNERDMLQIQNDVANRVVRSLASELLPASGADRNAGKVTRPEAYDAYLKGRYLFTKDTVEDFDRSVQYFEQAIAIDPNFAPAYVGATLARVSSATWQNTPAVEVLPKAKAGALKAVELDPSLAEAYAALAAVNFWLEWNWQEAEANIKRAIELNPSDPNIHLLYSSYLLSRGQIEAGESEVKQALQLDPVSLLTTGLSAYFYLRAQRFDEAITFSKRMLELEPHSPAAHECLVSALKFKGLYQEARDILLKRMAQTNARPESIEALRNGDARTGFANLDRLELARLNDTVGKGESVPASYIAMLYTNLGDKDRAFEWLAKAFAVREPMLVFFKVHPRWSSLRQDSRFTNLAQPIDFRP